MNALITLLDADVTLTGDSYVSGGGRPMVLQGAAKASKGAMLASSRAAQSRLALINGSAGIIWAPAGRLQVVLALTVNAASKITAIDIIADPDRLRRLRLAMLPVDAADGISQSAT
jgi:RNA polymerase sigma-70 factor (ECF subfamily)